MASKPNFRHEVLAFGPFRLFRAERVLVKSGIPIELGSRAFDILVALVERATEIVSRDDLLGRVWPNVTVEDTALRVNIARLRKILGDGPGGSQYITTIPGRGYCFSCPVDGAASPAAPVPEPAPAPVQRSLPPRLRGIIGRDEVVAALSRLLVERRLLSLIGTGGIGKTTVAVAIAHALLPFFVGTVHFIDMSSLRDPRLTFNLVARSFGLAVRSENLLPTILAYLHKRRVLIVLDSCEHVVAEVAGLVEHILQQTSDVFILVTSREPLGITAEQIHRLDPLRAPAPGTFISVAGALSFSAIELFVERVTAAGVEFALDDATTPLIAEICGRLDGIPLAIELVAAHVNTYGISGVARLLDDRLQLSIRGRRTALPRHQTLNATLDWSYELLTESQRRTLRCLSIFVGIFSLESAQAVCADPDNGNFDPFEAIASLVAKSLIQIEFQASGTSYRLLDTTRAYARAKLVASSEADAVASRHADYFSEILERDEARSAAQSGSEGLIHHGVRLGDIRAALRWAYSSPERVGRAVALAAAAAPLLLELSLLTECQVWTGRAIATLRPVDCGTHREMILQTAYGVSSIATGASGSDALRALGRALTIAEQSDNERFQLQLLEILYVTQLRMRRLEEAFTTARRADEVAKLLNSSEAVSVARCMMGLSYHFSGQHALARDYLEPAAKNMPRVHLESVRRFGVNSRINALCTVARILWLEGRCDAAFRAARDVVSEGQIGGNMMSYTTALALTVPVHLWRGDNTIAEEIINLLVDLATSHGLGPTLALALGWRGALATLQGRAAEALELLSASIRTLHESNYHLTTSVFRGFAAIAFASNGDTISAINSIDLAIDETARAGDLAYMPELLRTKGSIKAMSGDFQSAKTSLFEGLVEARRQSALSWELRLAVELAKLWQQQDRLDEALAVLSPIYNRFVEGFETRDRRTAARLLEDLGVGTVRTG